MASQGGLASSQHGGLKEVRILKRRFRTPSTSILVSKVGAAWLSGPALEVTQHHFHGGLLVKIVTTPSADSKERDFYSSC